MKKRHVKILNFLLYEAETVTGEKLAKRLNVSARTVRNDIKELNELYLKGVQISSDVKKGYYIEESDKEEICRFLTENNDEGVRLPNTPSERIFFIILKLVISGDFLTMELLGDMLFVSKSTISADIKKLKKVIDRQNNKLDLTISPVRGVLLSGKESDKRKLISNYIIYSKIGIETIRKLFELFEINMEQYYSIFNEYILFFEKHDIAFTDQSLMLMTVESIFIENRIRGNQEIEENYKRLSENIVPDVKQIFDKLEKFLQVKLGEREREYLNDCLNVKVFLERKYHAGAEIQDEAADITMQFLEKINKRYGIDFSENREVIENLSLHIASMISRLKAGIVLEDILVDDVKKNYPFSIDLATCIIPIMKRQYGFEVTENELVYIAVYIVVLMEQLTRKKRAVLVCGSGMGTARLLKRKLESDFSGSLEIIGCYTIYQLDVILKEEKPELIITTVPIHVELTIPVLQINPLFLKADAERLTKYLDENKQKLTKEKDLESRITLDNILDRELFFQFSEKLNDTQILKCMIDGLYQKKYISSLSAFLLSVLERERIYSTCYGKIWLPHSLECMSNKTTACIGIDRYNGRLIFLLAINAEEINKMEYLYDKIVKLVDRPIVVTELVKQTSYDAFMKLLQKV